MRRQICVLFWLTTFFSHATWAVSTHSKEVFNVCFFSSDSAKKLHRFSSYQDYEIDGLHIALEDDFLAAARRVSNLEAFSPIPLVIFGVSGSLSQDIGFITSEPGVEESNIVPGLTATMLFGNDFIKKLDLTYGPKSHDAFMVVLMHETGHYRMMRYLSHSKYKSIPTILKELHADFMAGWFTAYIQDTHYDGKKRYRNIGLEMFSHFGDLDTNDNQHHGTSIQRSTAFAFGWEVYLSQKYLDDLDTDRTYALTD